MIELLIVIVIVGILATIMIAVYNSSQEAGRDAKRKSDVDALKQALEFYANDTKGSYYPKEAPLASCSSATVATCIAPTALNDPSASPPYTYIKKIPKDPSSNNKDYYYKATKADGSDCNPNGGNYAPSNAQTSLCVNYKLVACLENAGDPQKDKPVKDAVACPGSGGASYTKTND